MVWQAFEEVAAERCCRCPIGCALLARWPLQRGGILQRATPDPWMAGHISLAAVEAPKGVRKHQRHRQTACTRNHDMMPPTELEVPDLYQEQVSEDEVRRAPQDVHPRWRQPLTWRCRERTLKWVPGDAAHEMRYRIGQKRSTEKPGDIMIPVHLHRAPCRKPQRMASALRVIGSAEAVHDRTLDRQLWVQGG